MNWTNSFIRANGQRDPGLWIPATTLDKTVETLSPNDVRKLGKDLHRICEETLGIRGILYEVIKEDRTERRAVFWAAHRLCHRDFLMGLEGTLDHQGKIRRLSYIDASFDVGSTFSGLGFSERRLSLIQLWARQQGPSLSKSFDLVSTDKGRNISAGLTIRDPVNFRNSEPVTYSQLETALQPIP